ncbi:MAG: 37S ribosomal protein S23 mitochondrial [Lichina confinis]|nr:MAG: 37S ribosomal protein S23 mitochondrial [Lichina confinis]
MVLAMLSQSVERGETAKGHQRAGTEPTKGRKTLRIAKKAPPKTGKAPAPGERRAFRKRIVLTNPNAIEVEGLKGLNNDTTVKESSKGTLLVLPEQAVDQLRELAVFKPTQKWRSFRKPAVLWTEQSLELARQLATVEEQQRPGLLRRMLCGEKGVGKSVMLLQAQATALSRGWVVMSIPECQDLTIAHTEYSPIPGTAPTTYAQNTYTASLLARISRANDGVLSTLELSKTHSVPIPLQSNLSLARLAQIGASDPDIAWPIFQALWDELTAPSTDQHRRPPVLFCVDGANHVMRLSEYRDRDFNLIHAHDLALVNHFMAYFSGATALPNGGAMLAATSMSNRPSTPTFSLALEQMRARARESAEKDVPQPSPFQKYDDRILDVLKDVEYMEVKKLSRHDTGRLLEYYAASGLYRETVDARRVGEKWTLSGGGVIGELERVALMPRV